MRQVNATQRMQIRLHWHSQDRQFDSEQITAELLGLSAGPSGLQWPVSCETRTQKQCMTLQCKDCASYDM